MKLADCFGAAVSAIFGNALRSILTTLGIVIGVAAVIIMVSIGAGARSRVDGVIRSLGSNLILVLPGSQNLGGVRSSGSSNRLGERDAEAIRNEVPEAVLVAAHVRGSAQIIAEGRNWNTQVQGVTNEFFPSRDWVLGEGRLFEEAELRAGKAAILGATVARNLFGSADPIGQRIRISRVPFEVVGVMKAKGQALFGQDQDDIVFTPLSSARQRLFGRFQSRPDMVDVIAVKGASAEALPALEASLNALMSRRHPPTESGEAYEIRNLGQLLEAQAASSRVLSLLLASVAGVSLVVGGIGVMNIMLVSVTERTREIGLRMAVGARRRDVLMQFLIESVVLSLLGGVIGGLLGVGGSAAIASAAEWPMLIEPGSVALAFGFSAAVGVFFGYYPALKASRLDPIEALRYE